MSDKYILRICLKDKSSILVWSTFQDIDTQSKTGQFIHVKNYNTGKEEMYNKDFIWCVRLSSENEKLGVKANGIL